MVWLPMEHQASVMTSARSHEEPLVALRQPPAQVVVAEEAGLPPCIIALRRHLQWESKEFCCATRPCSPDHWDSRSILKRFTINPVYSCLQSYTGYYYAPHVP